MDSIKDTLYIVVSTNQVDTKRYFQFADSREEVLRIIEEIEQESQNDGSGDVRFEYAVFQRVIEIADI